MFEKINEVKSEILERKKIINVGNGQIQISVSILKQNGLFSLFHARDVY